jgi:hypothetical protein
MDDRGYQEFSDQLLESIEKDYFKTIAEISEPSAMGSNLFFQLNNFLDKPVCALVSCSNIKNYNTTTFDYLVY